MAAGSQNPIQILLLDTRRNWTLHNWLINDLGLQVIPVFSSCLLAHCGQEAAKRSPQTEQPAGVRKPRAKQCHVEVIYIPGDDNFALSNKGRVMIIGDVAAAAEGEFKEILLCVSENWLSYQVMLPILAFQCPCRCETTQNFWNANNIKTTPKTDIQSTKFTKISFFIAPCSCLLSVVHWSFIALLCLKNLVRCTGCC